ncbi:hypothetical protein GDO81_000197 [Engystomops pustulosus]|uniref:Uncharacterized protein n=1 Tax=Engystomops pustulosus TaxID=76066 RepID=A0AAV7D3S3_ENGPU|nr:hypothetical protein GDO81_000197 [Engystomops pustulosus]
MLRCEHITGKSALCPVHRLWTPKATKEGVVFVMHRLLKKSTNINFPRILNIYELSKSIWHLCIIQYTRPLTEGSHLVKVS